MKCKNCGYENPNDVRFCTNCGAALSGVKEDEKPIFCPICGIANDPNNQKCINCGSTLIKRIKGPVTPTVQENIKTKTTTKKNRLTTIIGCVALLCIGAIGGYLYSNMNKETTNTNSIIYIPGTYTATSMGMGEVTVKVTFNQSSITKVNLDVSNETESIGQAAKDDLTEQIMDAQSADIDGVSGATVTTDAVKDAVQDCINQAKA